MAIYWSKFRGTQLEWSKSYIFILCGSMKFSYLGTCLELDLLFAQKVKFRCLVAIGTSAKLGVMVVCPDVKKFVPGEG